MLAEKAVKFTWEDDDISKIFIFVNHLKLSRISSCETTFRFTYFGLIKLNLFVFVGHNA